MDQFAINIPANVARVADRAWVADNGIADCAICVYEGILNRSGWRFDADAERVFRAHGYEPCNDEWCSNCDRDIPIAIHTLVPEQPIRREN